MSIKNRGFQQVQKAIFHLFIILLKLKAASLNSTLMLSSEYSFIKVAAQAMIGFQIMKSNVLLLHHGIYADLLVIAITAIHTDTFFENKFHAFPANSVAKVYQLAGFARNSGLEVLFATKVLVVVVLAPLLYDRLVGDVADVFEQQQT